jgi:hypothetical protein
MRDLAKIGKKEELAMFFGMQVKLAVGKKKLCQDLIDEVHMVSKWYVLL